MHERNGFVRTVAICDEQGRVIGSRQVVTYAGLLNEAHRQGLKSLRTKLIQAPSEANAMTAISLAEVVTEKGVFRDYGDASPTSVEEPFAPHIIRLASTRAKARALRDAINWGTIAVEELGEGPRGKAGDKPSSGNGNQEGAYHIDALKPMTGRQRKYLFKLLLTKGLKAEDGHEWLAKACEVEDIKQITKKQASDLIDHLVKEAAATEAASTAA